MWFLCHLKTAPIAQIGYPNPPRVKPTLVLGGIHEISLEGMPPRLAGCKCELPVISLLLPGSQVWKLCTTWRAQITWRAQVPVSWQAEQLATPTSRSLAGVPIWQQMGRGEEKTLLLSESESKDSSEERIVSRQKDGRVNSYFPWNYLV